MEASLSGNINVFDAFFDVSTESFSNWRYIYNYIQEEKGFERPKKNLLSVIVPT